MKFDQLVMILEADNNIEVKRTYWDKAKKKLRSVEYFLNGKYHRLDGPAYQAWNADGQKQFEAYYIHGDPVSKDVIDVYTKYNPEDRQTMDDLDLPDF